MLLPGSQTRTKDPTKAGASSGSPPQFAPNSWSQWLPGRENRGVLREWTCQSRSAVCPLCPIPSTHLFGACDSQHNEEETAEQEGLGLGVDALGEGSSFCTRASCASANPSEQRNPLGAW